MKFNYRIFWTNLLFVFLIYLVLFLSIANDGLFSYKASVYINVLIYIIFAVSLSVTVGLLGLLNLGHAGFIAVGAYAGGYISKLAINLPVNENIKFFVAVIFAGLIAGLVGLLMAFVTQKFNGDYLAIITLAFGEIIKYIIQQLNFLGGAQGLKGIPNYTNFTNTFIYTVITITVIMLIGYSKFGRNMVSVRENQIASENVGVNINSAKRYGFFISAFFAGIGGCLFAHNLGVILPDKFSFVFSIEVLVMVVFGGIGSISGAIMSASFITLINEFLREISEYRSLIYSIALILIIIYRPKGLLGTTEFKLNTTIEKIYKILKKIKGKMKNGIIKNKKYDN